MRVIVADDHPQVRSALGLLIEHEPELKVVGEATSADDLLTQIGKKQPDLVLLDWDLPGLPPTGLVRTIRTRWPGVLVIALSGQIDAHRHALLAGVDDFISKSHAPEQVLAVLRAFNAGYVGKINKQVVEEWMTSQVTTIPPEMRLQEADRLMTEKGVRRLPVVKEDRLIGIITRSDIRNAKLSDVDSFSIWQLNYSLSQLTVGRVMTVSPVTILAQATIRMAAQLMQEYKIGGLPVVDEQECLVGIITESDIFRMIVQRWSGDEEYPLEL